MQNSSRKTLPVTTPKKTPHSETRPSTAPQSHVTAKSKTIILSGGGRAMTETYPNKLKPLEQVTLTEQVEIEGLPGPMKVSLPETGPSDRQDYIEYALDMLTHNLIGSGQLSASQAYLVKTPELRSHISSLVDRVEASHQVGRSMQISSRTSTHLPSGASSTHSKVGSGTKWALQPNALPITIITNQDPNAKPVRRGNTGVNSRPGSATSAYYGSTNNKKRTNILSVPNSSSNKPQPNLEKSKPKLPISSLFQHQSPRPVSAGQQGQKLTPTPSSKNNNPSKPTTVTVKGNNKSRPVQQKPPIHSASLHSTFPQEPHFRANLVSEGLIMDEDSFRFKPSISISSEGGFRAKFDMRGFENEEISLDLQDRKLTVSGSRPKRDGMNQRMTMETVDIPVGVNLNQLKVARRLDGILQIQEFVMEHPQDNHY